MPARPRRRRIQLLLLLVVGSLVLLGARAAFLTTVRSADLTERAAGQQRREADVPAPRGAIISRDRKRLADDRLAVTVVATPYLVRDPERAATQLAEALDRDVADVTEALKGSGGYAVVARNVTPEAADRARELAIPGIEFEDTYERILPRGKVAAQLVGLVGDDRAGLSGLEAQLDDHLTGKAGYRLEARDPFGRPLRRITDREPVPGRSVRLTIDTVIQDRTERILTETREKFGAQAATAVVMRPSDGAILAMATVPGFDPEHREQLREEPELERNRPVTDTFEPGSTFKVVTIAAALEQGLVSAETTYDLPSTLTRYDRTLGEAEPRPPVRWTVAEILAKSSNIGTVLVGEQLGPREINRWIERFGFGRKTGVEFPGEVAGTVLPTEQWSGTSILNIPIGQGLTITLTQLAAAYAAIANGGRAVRPHLVSRVGSEPAAPGRGPRILSARTANALDSMLRGVVSGDGTGTLAQVEGFEVAGKTGTANKINPDSGEYDEYRVVASFVGYAPASRPQLLIAVAVDEPAGAAGGGDAAAPAFEQIAEFSLQTMGISP